MPKSRSDRSTSGTVESRVLDALDPEEGTESFNLPVPLRRGRAALQRLRRKGLAEPARCPDGAWVWFRVKPRGCVEGPDPRDSQLETSAGPCFAHPITHFHLHCGLPIGHEGLHRCFAAVTWGDYSAIQLDGVALEQLSERLQRERDRYREALVLIADTDPIDAALDPDRALRVARQALDA